MKTTIVIVILLSLTSGVEGKFKAPLELIDKAWGLISMSIDIGNLIEERENGDINEKLEELQHAINDMKNHITNEVYKLKDYIRQEIYFSDLRRSIEEVESCVKEYEHLKKNLHDSGIKDNFWNQCKDIIAPLRALGNILSGEKVIGVPNSGPKSTLMAHLIKKEGFCDGDAINDIFFGVFYNFAEGWAPFLMAQTYKHGNNTASVYATEFNTTLHAIGIYIAKEFQECSTKICSPDLQSKVKEITLPIIGESLNETLVQLHKKFPYFDFIILQTKSGTSDCPKLVSHDYMEFRYNGSIYRLYAFKYHKVSNKEGPPYKVIEYPLSDENEFVSTDIKTHKFCDSGKAKCFIKINVKATDADCFHIDRVGSTCTANLVTFSSRLIILSLSFGIIASMKI